MRGAIDFLSDQIGIRRKSSKEVKWFSENLFTSIISLALSVSRGRRNLVRNMYGSEHLALELAMHFL